MILKRFISVHMCYSLLDDIIISSCRFKQIHAKNKPTGGSSSLGSFALWLFLLYTLYKVAENSGESPKQFPEASGDVIKLIVFVKPTLQKT